MFSLALKILIPLDHDSQNAACFQKVPTEFPGLSILQQQNSFFSLKRKKKKKIKKNPIIPKTLHGEVSNTKVW